jgi:hypothetical protein
MNVPDYVSPIVGYRTWRWDASGLTSLNGELWRPCKPLAAACNIAPRRTSFVRTRFRHEAPQMNCRCGIYAAKSLGELCRMGYGQLGIYGEVYLWGVVVEHRLGWRAQFAYPKSLILSPASFPSQRSHDGELRSPLSAFFGEFAQSKSSREETLSALRTLTEYGADIFLACREENPIPIWTRHSGFQPAHFEPWKANAVLLSVLRSVTILTEDPERRTILKKRVEETNLAPVVSSQVGLPTHARDAIVFQVRDQRSKVVIVDLTPKDPLAGIRAIELIRAALGKTTIVAIGETRNLDNIMAAMFAGADEYVDRNDKRGLASTLARCILPLPWQRTRTSITPPGGSTPPNGPPPPPAVLVLSPQNWPRMPPRSTAAWAV